MYTCSTERMEDLIQTFSQFGATGNGGITRYSLSKEAIQARDEFVKRMKAIGAVIETDDVANVYATLPGTDPDAKRIVLGSHADSVMNGGNYDGILGVMSAMEVLTAVAEEKIEHTHPLTAMIWTNEEGSLYAPCMMSSGIVCYDCLPEEIQKSYKPEDMFASRSWQDPDTSFADAIERSGYKGPKENRISPDNALCLLEAHIEQGPILEDAGKDLGLVDCVLGMDNYKLTFHGYTTHAGTFPMPKRKDAFYAACQALIYLHDAIDALGHDDLVYTTGEVSCHPNLHTCVPDTFSFCIDYRHKDRKVLDQVAEIVKGCQFMAWKGCRCEVVKQWNRDTVTFHPALVNAIRQSLDESGYSYQPIHSGAGHDAQFASYMLPTAMVFVQSEKGVSHCEEEHSSVENCTKGATILLNAVLKIDQSEGDL